MRHLTPLVQLFPRLEADLLRGKSKAHEILEKLRPRPFPEVVGAIAF